MSVLTNIKKDSVIVSYDRLRSKHTNFKIRHLITIGFNSVCYVSKQRKSEQECQ